MAIAPLFNAYWYLQQNPDVAQAVSAGLIDARTHFELFGRQEGREASPLFDVAAYLEDNPDVAAAVAAGRMNVYEHFEQWGWEEDRSPLRLFDEALYLAHNPDVQTVVQSGQMTAVQHLLNFGVSEGRLVNAAVHLGQYMNANPDVPPAVQSGDISALEHLIMFGTREARDLGNGVSLGQFSNDPVFQQALESGNVAQALTRVADVAPFIPTFQRPEGWAPNPDHVIPVDFIPPPGLRLVVPDDITLPPGVVLPGNVFQPPAPTPGPTPKPDPWTLTTGVDSLTGTSGDDTFYGMLDTTADSTSSTLTKGDSISGGDGNDTFRLQVQGSGDVSPAPADVAITGIETVIVESTVDAAGGFIFSPASMLGSLDDIDQLLLRAAATATVRGTQTIEADMDALSLNSIVLENARDLASGAQRGSGAASFSIQNLVSDSHITLLENSGTAQGDAPGPSTASTNLTFGMASPGDDTPTKLNVDLGAADTDAAMVIGTVTTTDMSLLHINHETPESVTISVFNYQAGLEVYYSGGADGGDVIVKSFLASHLDASGLLSNLTITGGNTTDATTIKGGQGHDTIKLLTGQNSTASQLSGGKGDDLLKGANHDDTLEGGSGSDTFMFNGGGYYDDKSNFVSGTQAKDVQMTNGSDVITDFSVVEEDKLGILDILKDTANIVIQASTVSISTANVLVITDEQANGGVDLTAAEIDTLAAQGTSRIDPGFILLNNNGTTQLWYDEKIGQANGAQDVVLLATLTGFTDLGSLDASNFV